MDDFDTQLENLRQHILDAGRQNWLFGAGISFDANIPLMFPLTVRVAAIIDAEGTGDEKTIFSALAAELQEDSHIEHYLSHLGDLVAMVERSRSGQTALNGVNFSLGQLNEAYSGIIKAIGKTVRYGYKNNPEEIGTAETPIVEIDNHLKFVEALFSTRANLERRSSITFFTTNYDTLLEDALGLSKKTVVDGFSGGAVGFWSPEKEFVKEISNFDAYKLYKLHGSIDWHRDPERGLVRARYGTKYLSNPTDIMIYPQATKYVATQKDPFSSLFHGFRSTLGNQNQNILITCGYSFGDEHINEEIESALNAESSSLILVAFTEEKPVDGGVICPVLDRWLCDETYGKRVFVGGKNGLYNDSITPISPGTDLFWWTFSGLTNFLQTGEVSWLSYLEREKSSISAVLLRLAVTAYVLN